MTRVGLRSLLTAPRAPVNRYPPLLVLNEKRLRALVTAESSEALGMARSVGLEVPHAKH